jgi:8-oxo-dGTP diphosphatase
MENALRNEILEAIKHRQTLDLAKISFVTALLGLGSIDLTNQGIPKEILYLAPLVAIFFDMLIMGQTFSIRRLGAFLQTHSSDPLEAEYETYVSQHRDNYFKYGSSAITVISLFAAIILFLDAGKIAIRTLASSGAIWWFIFALALFLFTIIVGNYRIQKINKPYKTIKATVAAIVTQDSKKKSEKVLLTQRAIPPFKNQWCLPGGHIDAYEPAKEALIREVREETGLKFKAHFFDYFDEIIPGLRHHNLVLVFYGTGEGELIPQEDEVLKIEWVSLSEALTLDLAFEHKKILETYSKKSTDVRRNK